jgi:succinylglutamate desuccinylase
MISSADRAMLADLLSFTLAGDTPSARAGLLDNGIRWVWRDAGVVSLEAPVMAGACPSVVISSGIHGDETAPIELASRLVDDLYASRTQLACRLLVILGNVDAMRAGVRYVDDDLNRMFRGKHGDLPGSHEAPRAAALEQAVADFFDAAHGARWHFDLHTAIRPSVFEKFALLPSSNPGEKRALLDWTRGAGLDAILLHTSASNTFSHHTAERHAARSCTLELGKVHPFGQNDLSNFARPMRALADLLAGVPLSTRAALPPVFQVIAQIEKRSQNFEFFVDQDVPNFTPFVAGTVLARDGDYCYEVAHAVERIVFPNPAVKPGLRAGLMVVEVDADTSDVQ